ncbi:MAG TPA: rod shape-determining protein MreC [Vicinamibacteria bacterium]|nr:rod shape-determining protein MreC [Vicinamibacteria bacterium]
MAAVLDARRSRYLLVGLVLLHLGAISHQVDGGGGASLLQRAVFSLLSPLQNGVSAVVRGVSGAWTGYLDLRGTVEENRRLSERLRLLETQLQERAQQARDAERLRELLGLREILPLETTVAEVVTRDGLPWYRTITINKGSEDGLALEAPVISPTGVVGRIIGLGPGAAKVQLLQDRDSGAGVLIARSRVAGVVSGQVGSAEVGSHDLVMKYVPELGDVVVGDLVVTSGQDRIYPKGLVVGRVRSVGKGSGLFKDISVEPSARVDRLEEVLVVKRQKEPLLLERSVR